MNITIEERINRILSNDKLPMLFLGESIRTVVNLINLSPLGSLDDDVPNRVWKQKDVSYKHLEFRCKGYVHFLKDERSKLDNKFNECIFLGCSHDKFRYRLWDIVG